MKFSVYILFSCCLHILFIISITDIYFVSPLVNVTETFYPQIKPIASRLVLFVADGLRADKVFSLYENNKTRSPYLRNVMLKNGVWGIIHDKPPTESRPCHVSMTSGFYEDVSSIYKGWKENYVDFDSIFNKSQNTWAFGSYEVLPIFAKGHTAKKYHMQIYNGDSDDKWVFNKFEEFFRSSKSNSNLMKMLQEKEIIFFLHLVATDTFGHRFGSSSENYVGNIQTVDDGIKKVVKIIQEFYQDDKQTAFLFVSDHGMTDAGSHGSGSAQETESPLIAWGSGFTPHAVKDSKLSLNEKKKTMLWGLDPKYHNSITQIDLAPLMASLLAIPVPSNSMGILPVSLLSANASIKARLMLSNAKQTCSLFHAKAQAAWRHSFFVFPFLKLSWDKALLEQNQVSNLIEIGRYDEAIVKAENLINLSLEASNYYNICHRFSLFFVIISSYLGWIAVSRLVMYESRIKTNSYQRLSFKLVTVFILTSLFVCIYFLYLKVPLLHYFYYLSPLCIWCYVAHRRSQLIDSLSVYHIRLVFYLLLCSISLVLCFLFRRLLAFMLIFLAITGCYTKISLSTKIWWFTTCFFSSLFPLFFSLNNEPKSEHLFLGSCFAAMLFVIRSKKFVFIAVFPVLAGLFVYWARAHLSQSYASTHFISWIILVFTIVLPMLYASASNAQYMLISACHCTCYFLVSLNDDAYFMVVFSVFLMSWISLEVNLNEENEKSNNFLWVETSNFRIAYLMMLFLIFSFLGLGSVTSLSHINVNTVSKLFVSTTSSHYIKLFLLIYKISLPCMLVISSVLFCVIQCKLTLKEVACSFLIVGDIMSMFFLVMVRDHGSWADIGVSIARYVICASSVAVVIALFLFNKIFLRQSRSLGHSLSN